MSPIADTKSLRAAFKSGAYAPVYYFYGDDDYLKDDEVRQVIGAAVDPDTREFNFETRRGTELDAESLGSILSTPPMMADRRVVVIREVNALKKEVRGELDKYLKNPASDTLLLLVAASGTKVDKKLADATATIEFEPLKGHRIPKWISYYVEHDLDSTITDDAVKLLQEAVGTDLSQLRIELDKLASFAGGEPINIAAITAVVGVRPGETMGDFLDAVARRDAKSALAMICTVLEQPKANGVTTVMALTAQTLCIGWAQASRERGAHPAKLSGDLFNLLKSSGSVFTGRSWGEFVAACVRGSDTWTPRAIDDALDALLVADAALKESRVSSDEQLLANLVLALCGTPSRRRAA
jgi:DNA polymerase III subunit delta